jgi:alkylated DNA nucleotide flippase Atl1
MLGLATPNQRDDARLDRGPCLAAIGRVTALRETEIDIEPGEPAVIATFTYTPEGEEWEERRRCYAAASLCTIGNEVDVEYLADSPHTARIVGGRLTMQPDLATPWIVIVVVPGILAALAWFAGVLRLRHMMRHADIAIADQYEVKRGVWSVPETLEVRFWFRDFRARRVVGKHWLRARSAAGEPLAFGPAPTKLAIAHDREAPERWHRVVHPDDFGVVEETGREPDTSPVAPD